MSVEDLVRDMEHMHMEAVLQHVAWASLTCTGPRTLGPDRPIWQPASHQALAEEEELKEESVDLKQIAPAEPLPSTFPDANAINAYKAKRELTEQCQKSVRQQLKTLKEQRQTQRLKWEAEQEKQTQNKPGISHQQNEQIIKQKADQMTKTQIEAQQREQLQLRQQTDQKLHKLALEGVARCQRRFGQKYEAITKMLLSLDKETVQACGSHNLQLRELGRKFDQLINQVKAGNCEQSQFLSSILKAEQHCRSLDELELNLLKQLAEFSQHVQQQLKLEAAKRQEEQEQEKERLRAEEREKEQQKEAQEEEAKKKQEEAAQAAIPAPIVEAPAPAPAPTSQISSSYVHPTRLAFYNEINALYQAKVEAIKPLQNDESLKQYRTNCQRAINLPLNAISAVSPQYLANNFDKLYQFFAGQPVKAMNGSTITINDHPLARDYCLLLMAKKFVSQTETSISSNPQAAFPFASVIMTFWKLLPDFGKIFLAYIFKESPYLVPYVIPQQPGQTPEQYLKTMGYRLSDSNELEKPDMFLKRQTGLARLYAAVIITPGRKANGPEHCYGLEEGWRWLVHIVHVKPLPDICATLIMEMLNTLGFELWRTYGRQFLKLLFYIQTHYIPQLAAYDEGGPKTRLEMLLAKFLREQQIPQAVGALPPGFW